MTKSKSLQNNVTKVIFLDIDGVLNTYRTQAMFQERYSPYRSDLEPELMENLMLILEKHRDCRLIIHSAWRESLSAFELRCIFRDVGYPIISERIFGVANPELEKPAAINEMIQMLRLEHSKYVIIDDDALFGMDDPKLQRHVKTSLFAGLTKRRAVEVSEMLDEVF